MDELAKRMFEARLEARQLLDDADDALQRADAHAAWRREAIEAGTYPSAPPPSPPPPPTPPPPPASISRADAEKIAARKVEELRQWTEAWFVTRQYITDEFATLLGEEIGEVRRSERRHYDAELAKMRLEMLELRTIVAEIRLARTESGDGAKIIDLPSWPRRGAS